MTLFQLLLMIASAVIFAMFFRQIFNGTHPKRGIDFEAKTPDDQIGSISHPDKLFSKTEASQDRVEQLHESADKAVENGDMEEAKKALGSALILDDTNTETLYKLAYVHLQQQAYEKAKEYLEKLLFVDSKDDMAEALLANVLHRLGDDAGALQHHALSVKLDPEYALHYFNYANTLYDLDRKEEALVYYQKSYTLDLSVEDAAKMIEKLSE